MSDPASGDALLDLTEDLRGRSGPFLHRWFGRRGPLAARAVVALTAAPEMAADSSAIEKLLDPQLGDPNHLLSHAVVEGRPTALLDLCAGVGTVSEAALRLGLVPTAIDLHPIAVLASRCLLIYPPAYAKTDRRLTGAAEDHSWSGLAQELLYWSQEVLTAARADLGELWLETIVAVTCGRIAHCPNPACGDERPLALSTGTESSPSASAGTPYARAEAKCPRCHFQFRLNVSQMERWAPVALITEDPRGELPVPPKIADILTSAAYPASIASRLDEAWALGRLGPIKHRIATTARQATILDAFRRSVRRARETMADARYPPDRIVALSTYLALAASDLVDYLCTGAVLRQGRIQPALSRPMWTTGFEFVEIGGRTLEKLWQRRIKAMIAIIEANAALPQIASVLPGDMTKLPVEYEGFDLVVWDPPFYDNIDYDVLAGPWTSFLRSVIGELDATLPWPQVRPSEDTAVPEHFDPQAYEQSLSAAASEVVRAARPGARLGVFWVSRVAQDLQRFVDLMQPHGLELIQTIALRTELVRGDAEIPGPGTYLLILRVLKQAGGPSGRVINAERLLELSSSGQQSMNAGLAEILAESWDRDEIDAHLPTGLRGSLNQRLAEFAASQPDPTDLLRELGSSRLRREAQRLGCDREQLAGLDTAGLARQVIRQLGFTVPSAPIFSIGAALHDADRARSRLQLAVSAEDLTGSGMKAIEAVERVLRFSVVTWCTHSREEEWEHLIQESLGKTSRLSFGDWVELFTAIPKRLVQESDIYLRVHRMLKASRVVESLQPLVQTRNRLAHPEPGQNWMDMRIALDGRLHNVIRKLQGLLDEAALPIVLQPIEEIRDRFSRFRLRLLDHEERDVELIVTGATDLTRPRILLRSNSNPREVDPELLDASIIEERMGLRSVSQE